MYRFFNVVFLLIFSTVAFAQQSINHVQSNYTTNISKTKETIKIDGALDEAVWKSIVPATNFWMKFPTNDAKAKKQTEVRLTYNDKFLYVGVVCHNGSNDFLVQTLKRDKGLRSGDGFAMLLDPYNQKANGFFFGVNVHNAQSDDLLSGGDNDISFSWDNTWYSETKIYEDKWTAEFAIPFNILRFDPTKTTWGINFIRSDRRKNHFHTWTQIPLNFRGIDMGYLGQLNWDAAPPKSSSKVSINPYVSTGLNADKQNNIKTNATANAGVDAKIAVTPSINLDLTVNPDFSNVDVDRQVTNLSRFSVFFPERRAFFLENDDLFSSYGIPPIRPFYSRRIGSSNGKAVPILFGARLSGNFNKDTRFGLMNIQTGKKSGEAASNFTAASVQKRVLARSNIKGYVLNKESFLNQAQKAANPLGLFARNIGTELNYSNKSGKWNAWYGHHASFKPNVNNKNQYINTGIGYNGQKFENFINIDILGTNYYTDMGFTQRILNYDASLDSTIRRGFRTLTTENKVSHFFKKESRLNRLSVEGNIFLALTPENKFNEFSFENHYQLEFKNSATIQVRMQFNKEKLLYASKFVNSATALPIPVGNYAYKQISFIGNSDLRKNFSFETEITFGTYYNADFKKAVITFNARKQPKLNFSLNMEYNQLDFPRVYGSENFLLIAPVVEYNFSNKMFWTTFFQYNTQANNFNINSRLQYRFKPMSDLFVVYTDNYFTNPLMKGKNRALVLKLNYWLNL